MEKLWPHFHRGVKQNDSQYITYRKACVAHELAATGATASDLTKDSQAFKDACASAGSQRGEKSAMIAHLIGGRVECSHSSDAAKAVAATVCKETKDAKSAKDPESKKHTRTDSTGSPDVSQPPKKKHTQSMLSSLVFRRNDMPFGDDEKAALEKHALRAIVSSGAAFQFFEDPEVKILFGMLHTTAPDILPSAKVVGGDFWMPLRSMWTLKPQRHSRTKRSAYREQNNPSFRAPLMLFYCYIRAIQSFNFFPLSVPVALKPTPIVLPSPLDRLSRTTLYPAPFR
ncbi:hypothetical protein B0H16DRAFT_1479225 [Mycena metata]|uniref:Uncharacterized protein n=1 Tax=Mycena metata TaxID=1033252 RepID=A0AAD7H5X8_9AGAR|nr:hypothetical protein B0H16DRAFT_1479225 [Mycena metata]